MRPGRARRSPKPHPAQRGQSRATVPVGAANTLQAATRHHAAGRDVTARSPRHDDTHDGGDDPVQHAPSGHHPCRAASAPVPLPSGSNTDPPRLSSLPPRHECLPQCEMASHARGRDEVSAAWRGTIDLSRFSCVIQNMGCSQNQTGPLYPETGACLPHNTLVSTADTDWPNVVSEVHHPCFPPFSALQRSRLAPARRRSR